MGEAKERGLRYVVLIPEGYATGPFKTKKAADEYVAADWQKGLRVIELVPPAKD